MRAIRLELDECQRATLEQMQRRHPRAYLREKATALLKVAAGQSAERVACAGLLRPRKPDTVRGWVRAYQQGGLTALVHKPRRRRRFSP